LGADTPESGLASTDDMPLDFGDGLDTHRFFLRDDWAAPQIPRSHWRVRDRRQYKEYGKVG
ncbi:hypothetical protein, partial [Rivihabitans pingtungensis]|uniref:hypothetical protein n=1 Tax=Rivihabitans pingtungensis TaxID=1054498 RepID=UPI002FDB4FF3